MHLLVRHYLSNDIVGDTVSYVGKGLTDWLDLHM